MGILSALFGGPKKPDPYKDIVLEITRPLVDEAQVFYMAVDKLATSYGFTASDQTERMLHILVLLYTIAMEQFHASGRIAPGDGELVEGELMSAIIMWFSIHIARGSMSHRDEVTMCLTGREGYHTFQNIRRTGDMGLGVGNYLATLMSSSRALDDQAKRSLQETFQKSEGRIVKDTNSILAR